MFLRTRLSFLPSPSCRIKLRLWHDHYATLHPPSSQPPPPLVAPGNSTTSSSSSSGGACTPFSGKEDAFHRLLAYHVWQYAYDEAREIDSGCSSSSSDLVMLDIGTRTADAYKPFLI